MKRITNAVLDKCCKYKNSFYATGFCKFDYSADVCAELNEVTDMFMNWSISDPVTGEVVAFAGGEDDDAQMQMMLEVFASEGFSVRPFDVGA